MVRPADERVLIQTGRTDIKPDALVFVERAASFMKTHTMANVSIEGHTDNVGPAAMNPQLSDRRAAADKDPLVKQGVAAARTRPRVLAPTSS